MSPKIKALSAVAVAQNEAGFQAQSAATFEHAMRAGPRLQSEPGTPEFVASYNAAVATKIAAPEGQLLRLLQEYQRSQDFLGLRDKTRSDYIAHIKKDRSQVRRHANQGAG